MVENKRFKVDFWSETPTITAGVSFGEGHFDRVLIHQCCIEGTVSYPFKDIGYNMSLMNIIECHKDKTTCSKRFSDQERATGLTISLDKVKPTIIYTKTILTKLTSIKKADAATPMKIPHRINMDAGREFLGIVKTFYE